MWIKIPGSNVTFRPDKHPRRPVWLFQTIPHAVRTVAEVALGMSGLGALALALYQYVVPGWLIAPGYERALWHFLWWFVPVATALVSTMALWGERQAAKVYSSVWLESLHDTIWTPWGWIRSKPAPVWDSEEFPDLFWTINDGAGMLSPHDAARALALHWVGQFTHDDGSIDAEDADWMYGLSGRARAVVVDGDGKRHEFNLRELLFSARCLAPGVWPAFAWQGINDDNDPDGNKWWDIYEAALTAWRLNYTTVFTVQIEAANESGDIWQAVAPAETVDLTPAPAPTARGVAEDTAANQTVADGRWRVRVWLGSDADTGTEPAAEVYGLGEQDTAEAEYDADDDDVNPFINEESG